MCLPLRDAREELQTSSGGMPAERRADGGRREGGRLREEDWGRDGGRKGGREGGREGDREIGTKAGTEGGSTGERQRGWEGGREAGRQGGMEWQECCPCTRAGNFRGGRVGFFNGAAIEKIQSSHLLPFRSVQFRQPYFILIVAQGHLKRKHPRCIFPNILKQQDWISNDPGCIFTNILKLQD